MEAPVRVLGVASNASAEVESVAMATPSYTRCAPSARFLVRLYYSWTTCNSSDESVEKNSWSNEKSIYTV